MDFCQHNIWRKKIIFLQNPIPTCGLPPMSGGFFFITKSSFQIDEKDTLEVHATQTICGLFRMIHGSLRYQGSSWVKFSR